MERIRFKVNGKDCSVGSEQRSSTTLVDYLRNGLGLTGVKYMCREGGCGACIVMASKHPGAPPMAVNACLPPIALCHGWDITTVEGIGNRKDGYHVIQKTLAEHNGSQCGHCSTGFVMAMYSLLKNKPKPTMLEIENYFSSNVCRCTGYRSIMEAFKTFAKDAPTPNTLHDIEDLNICHKTNKMCLKTDCEDKEWCFVDKESVGAGAIIKIVLSDNKVWYKVYAVADILKIFNQITTDDYMLIAGNTGYGVYHFDEYPSTIIDINGIPELKGYMLDQNLVIGSGTTITELLDIFNDVATNDDFLYLNELHKHLLIVANTAVRNVGTVGGNLMLKHKRVEFASDIYLMMTVAGAMITIQNRNERETLSTEDFLRKNMKGSVITNVIFPPLGPESRVVTIKVTPRFHNCHCVSAGFHYTIKNNIFTNTRIVYAGLTGRFQRAKGTEIYVNGKNLFNNSTLQSVLKVLDREITADFIPGEPSPHYRQKLAVALFYKGILKLCPEETIGTVYRSGATMIHAERPAARATQVYDTDPTLWPINEPWPKVDGLIQCAGEAKYTDDVAALPREVYASFLLTTVGLGTIVSIDPSAALNYPGVIAIYTAEDIPGTNNLLPKDLFTNAPEEVFCSGEVKYFNQPYGIVVAETRHIADVAAKLVKVTYANIKTPVTDVREAKKDPNRIKLYFQEDAKDRGTDVAKVIKGSNTTGRQFHFTMETYVCLSVPTEEGLKLYSTTQWLDGVQMSVANALNIDENRIDVQVRRVGGAFGAKVSRNNRVAIGCSLVSYKLNRPCRLIQSLQTTTRSVGKRSAAHGDYEVAVNENGVIQYMNYNIFLDDGYVDSEFLLMLGNDCYFNCYNKERWNFKDFNCRTDTAKNSWFRAPTIFEFTALIEMIMDHIAYEMNLDPIEVRRVNIDKEKYGDIIPMIDDTKQKADYDNRKKAMLQFNKENRWIKKGVSLSILRWNSLPMSNLEVNLSVFHDDGTVIITHGGIEIGQGIDTKAIQICAKLLNIDKSKIIIKGNNTIISPNCMYTAGSVTSQNACIGIQKCCQELLARLEPIRQTLDNPTWQELINKAHDSTVDLQIHAHVNMDDYVETICYGVAVVEVLVDILTGQSEVVRVDLMQDVGQSVNPVIDLGQIEGAFIQGQGCWTTEDLIHHSTGELLTDRTWNYFVPQARDIPCDFRVYFRKNSYSSPTIFGAKCVQEAPLCLSVGVALAIREALTAARANVGIPTTQWFPTVGAYTIDKTFLASETPIEHYKLH